MRLRVQVVPTPPFAQVMEWWEANSFSWAMRVTSTKWVAYWRSMSSLPDLLNRSGITGLLPCRPFS